jgi:uracil phosphoribosyltransferase/phosphoserine phosphatase
MERYEYCDNRPHPADSPSTKVEPADCAKPVIIGLYGLPGSGKTARLEELKTELSNDEFAFYDGSAVIAAVTPGGLEALQNLTEEAKNDYRERAIAKIKQECYNTGKTGIMAEHFMFWPEKDEHGWSVCTPGDLDTYTHILYLDVPAELIVKYRLNDTKRSRPNVSSPHLAKWQTFEKNGLRHLCRHHDILFMLLSPPLASISNLGSLVRNFRTHSEAYNKNVAEKEMLEILAAGSGEVETVIVLDADKTLAQEDSGVLFWEHIRVLSGAAEDSGPLKALFNSPLGYSYIAFRQATLLYEEAAGNAEFEAYCQAVALKIRMHRDIVNLLHLVRGTRHVLAAVVTCGIRSVWEKVFEREEGLSATVKVIGGGRLDGGLVVTPSVKGELVNSLRTVRNLYVFAFGDSPLDLEMLKAADEAIIITGEEKTRSKSMEKKLAEIIGKNGFQPCQAVLPAYASPRIDITRLPLVRLTDQHFIAFVFARYKGLLVLHATDRPAAKLLMTPMRDASISGSALRKVHGRVGFYLATEFCTQVIGLESYHIPHVQGHQADGYRLLNEKWTLIVPLMRGGEPVAFGVSDAFPLAMFHHAKVPSDLQYGHLKDMATIILVDSVVNTGKSILQFVQHVRNLNATICIVVVVGVIHTQTVSTSRIGRELGRFDGLSFVALRLSDNKFTARGTTDTGNRLFNTVHMA